MPNFRNFLFIKISVKLVQIDYNYLSQGFNQLNVLIVGDVILDHYLIGRVDRISPEAPVPVVLHESEDYRLGGAANVALNIKKMGATPYLLSLIGGDHQGERLVKLLNEEEIDGSYLVRDEKRTTTCKTRILARNQQLLRYDYEETTWLNSNQEEQLLDQIKTVLHEQKIDAIVFQDYNKGLLTKHVIQQVMLYAKAMDVPTLADPKKANFLSYKGVDFFKPNLREINEGLNVFISETQPRLKELVAAATAVQEALDNHCTLITLGARGIFYQLGEHVDLVPTKERTVADVCGAGDTVISIIALGVAARLPIHEIVALANIAGGQVCEQVGVVPINKKLLLKEYYSKEYPARQ